MCKIVCNFSVIFHVFRPDFPWLCHLFHVDVYVSVTPKSQIRICNFNFHNKRVITLRHIDTDKLHYHPIPKLHWQINAFLVLKSFPLCIVGLKLFLLLRCRSTIALFIYIEETPNQLICIMFFKQSHKLLFSHCLKLRLVYILLGFMVSFFLCSCAFACIFACNCIKIQRRLFMCDNNIPG